MVEREAFRLPGWLMLVVVIALGTVSTVLFVQALPTQNGIVVVDGALLGAGIGLAIVTLLLCTGFLVIQPNMSRVVVFLGRYMGTIKKGGWRWTWPFTKRYYVSLRVQTFD